MQLYLEPVCWALQLTLLSVSVVQAPMETALFALLVSNAEPMQCILAPVPRELSMTPVCASVHLAIMETDSIALSVQSGPIVRME